MLAALWYFLGLRPRLKAGTAGPTRLEQLDLAGGEPAAAAQPEG